MVQGAQDGPIRVLIADDHPVVLLGVAAALAGQPDIQVVGEARTLEDLLRQTAEQCPDLVILDLELGPDSEPLRPLRRRFPDVALIVYTAHDDTYHILDSIAAGVQGYLLKSADPAGLVSAVRVVHAGGTMLEPGVATKLVRNMGDRQRQAPELQRAELSNRELQVLKLMSEGKSNGQIGERLFINERTVKFHVSSILRKLEAQNRTEATFIAARLRIFSDGEQPSN